MAKNFRLYIKEKLCTGQSVTLDEAQTHYLKNVVKYDTTDTLCCFDGKNGEFSCQINELGKKSALLTVKEKIRPLTPCPDIWLLFAPLKKDKTDFVIEKATELGCQKICPVLTRYTNTTNIKLERYLAQSIEAAEQCKRTDIPQISPPQELAKLLADWDSSRTLFFMDETMQSADFLTVLTAEKTAKAAVLIGPEGGFAPNELTLLRNAPFAKGATLGPRILRAETAAAAALSCWQLILGDWRQ